MCFNYASEPYPYKVSKLTKIDFIQTMQTQLYILWSLDLNDQKTLI